LDRYRSLISTSSTNLVDAIERHLDTVGFDFETAWSGVFPRLKRAIVAPSSDMLVDAVQLGLRLAAVGHAAGSWSAEIKRHTVLRWGDVLLPPVEQVAVSSEGGRATLKLRGRGTKAEVSLVHGLDGWECEVGTPLSRVCLGSTCVLLLSSDSVDPGFPGPDIRQWLANGVGTDVVTSCRDALALLQNAGAYESWVRGVVREVVILQQSLDSLLSGSSSEFPGCIYLSLPNPPSAVAEMFVHEASHQYFHILAAVEPVDDGSDPSLYFSPPVGRERPLSRILVAFHAFANVALFYDECRRLGLDAVPSSARLESLLPMLNVLERPLRGNEALTVSGRALFYPLCDRLESIYA